MRFSILKTDNCGRTRAGEPAGDGTSHSSSAGDGSEQKRPAGDPDDQGRGRPPGNV